MDAQEDQGVTNDKAANGQPKGKAAEKKRSLIGRAMRRVGWLAGGPADWFGRKSVRSGAELIGKLWQQTRSAQQRDGRFKVDEAGGFDLAATAFSYGMSVQTLEQRLEQRRCMTSMISYGALFVALLGIIFWVHSAIDEPYTFARMMMVWEFLPFLALFLLVAFYNALLNFQIRLRRTAGWREFLSTEEGFFPR
ncbi:hypothetical protein GCM10010909_10700 [Acidocella aquatica]|uniref:Uncharacterized protein n=1 Tax=Acidocella aquatica TaxID=1922313 RepID=A0ABQ6A540_9PROT|nr:hypothetical protein [Acidocella aquatica]GLR66390.1 hypothetical protein GCM10010909_10700 [Acidocella aquatica]